MPVFAHNQNHAGIQIADLVCSALLFPMATTRYCLGVAQAVSAISATFVGIDRDVAVTGALLHDIGKLDAYTNDPLAIDMTALGRLHGEIPLGYYRVRRAIERLAPVSAGW